MTWIVHWYWHVKVGYVAIHAQVDVALEPSAQPMTIVQYVIASPVMLETLM